MSAGTGSPALSFEAARKMYEARCAQHDAAKRVQEAMSVLSSIDPLSTSTRGCALVEAARRVVTCAVDVRVAAAIMKHSADAERGATDDG